MPSDDSIVSLQARVEHLERCLDARRTSISVQPSAGETHSASLSGSRTAITGLILSGGIALSYLGLGEPNHPYQVMLGTLATALAYHRRWFGWPSKPAGWILAALNAVQVSLLFKLLIGSGVRRPLEWLRVPELIQGAAGAGAGWLPSIPSLQWSSPGLSGWQLDLTLAQTFLLILTLIGALFRFQPFASLTAIFLILCSVPAFGAFNWTWVFPAMTVAAIGLYLQTDLRRSTFT